MNRSRRAVESTERTGAHPRRRRFGQDAGDRAPHCLPHARQACAAVADPGGYLHQQGRGRDARPGTENSRDRLAKTCCSVRSMRSVRAYCARELRQLGWEEGFTIYDDADQLAVVKDVLKSLDINEKRLSPRAVLNTISRAKDELITPHVFAEHAQGPFEEAAARVYRRYQDTLRDANALDFNDLIMFVVQLFREHPGRAGALSGPLPLHPWWTNTRIRTTRSMSWCGCWLPSIAISVWWATTTKAFTVGGEPTCATSWTSSVNTTTPLSSSWKQNYRSTQNILGCRPYHHQPSAKPPRQAAMDEKRRRRAVGGLAPALDEEDEARLIVNSVRRLRDEGLGLSDCVVMYRTNAQSRALEDALVTHGIPYQLVGGVAFYQRREVKDALALSAG